LKNYDKEWSPYSDINNTKYDNLPPGKYTFKVKSCNNEGIWNIEPAVLFRLQLNRHFIKHGGLLLFV
jgi:hypothetical protein